MERPPGGSGHLQAAQRHDKPRATPGAPLAPALAGRIIGPVKPPLLPPACLALLAMLPAAPASAQAPPWHVGSFSAEVSLDGERTLVSVRCESPQVCEAVLQTVGTTPSRAARLKAEHIEPTDPTVPNNNLDHTREAVRANPKLYDAPEEGPLLQALRPLLDSQARFSRCVSVSPLNGEWPVLCQVDGAAAKLPDAVLLLHSMIPSCGAGPFCAYYPLPLQKQR